MNRYCLALDLKDDPKIIEQYIEHHKRVSDEIIASIKNADIQVMDIYLTGNRLFMIMEVGDTFKSVDSNFNMFVIKWFFLI